MNQIACILFQFHEVMQRKHKVQDASGTSQVLKESLLRPLGVDRGSEERGPSVGRPLQL